MIDTLKTAKALEASGLAPAQAEAVAAVLGKVSKRPSNEASGVSHRLHDVSTFTELRADIRQMKREFIGWWLISQTMVVIAWAALPCFDVYG